MSDNGNTKEIDPKVIRRSVQSQPANEYEYPRDSFVLHIAQAADGFFPWGRQIRQRDLQLRQFWNVEPILAGAVTSTAAARAAYSFRLDGPQRTVKATMDVLHNSDFGRGIVSLMLKTNIDLLTQDNGAFWEVVRITNSPDSPVIGLEHLDAAQCIRTGNPRVPVIYIDPRSGIEHKLSWHQVVTFEEMPSPISTLNNIQYCAVTRVLKAAQILRDIEIFKQEKIGGRRFKSIHFVGGVNKTEISDVRARVGEQADNEGLMRWVEPLIIAGLDPEKPVSVASIDLANLPDNFDIDVELKWYIAMLALGFGADYQDFAPLPGGNLGTSSQSEILHRKSRGKGSAIWMKTVVHKMHHNRLIPGNVEWIFDEQDTAADKEIAALKKTRAESAKIDIDSGRITPQIARQMMVDDGDLKPEYLELMNEQDLTTNVSVGDEESSIEEEINPNAVAEQEINPNALAEQIVIEQEKSLIKESISAIKSLVKSIRNKSQSTPQNITISVPPAVYYGSEEESSQESHIHIDVPKS